MSNSITIEMDLKTIDQRLTRIENLLHGQKQVLKIDEVSILTGKSKSHLYKLTCASLIPHYKQGKHLYFDRQEIESWLKVNRIKCLNEIDQEATSYVTLNKEGGRK